MAENQRLQQALQAAQKESDERAAKLGAYRTNVVSLILATGGFGGCVMLRGCAGALPLATLPIVGV